MQIFLSDQARTLARDERGLSSVEYVLLMVLLASVAYGTWSSFGSSVQGKLAQASDRFSAMHGNDRTAPRPGLTPTEGVQSGIGIITYVKRDGGTPLRASDRSDDR